MAKVVLECGACGAENERKEKPEPKNAREENQVYFICGSCHRKNFRNGSWEGEIEEEPQEEEEAVEVAPVTERKPVEKKEDDDWGFFAVIGAAVVGVIAFLLGRGK